MSHLTINFNKIYFCHCEYLKCLHGCNAGMEMSAPLINTIIDNALFHSLQLAHQSDAASNHSRPALFSGVFWLFQIL